MYAYSNKNGVKLLAVIAVLAMVVCVFAAIMPAGQTDAAPGDEPTYIHGGITSEQTYGDGTEVIIDGNLTIPSGTGLKIAGDFTVNEGVTVTIQAGGYLIFENSANATINGNIVATGKNPLNPADVDAPASNNTYYPSIVNKVTVNNETNYLTVNGSISLERGAVMSNTADKVETESSLDDSANGMIVLTNGASLEVTKRSNDVSVLENQNILLNEGATLSINGKVGNVYVQSTGSASYRTEAAVSINAGGLTIDYANLDRNTSSLTFTVTNQSISAVAINNDEQRYTVRQYILNVDGEVAAGDVLATVNDEGTTVKSGSYNPLGECLYFNPVKNENASANVILPKVSVTGSLTVTSESTIQITTKTYFDVSGTVDIESTRDGNNVTAGKAIINGAVHVTGTVTAVYANGNITTTHTDTGLNNATDIIHVEDGSVQITDAGFEQCANFNIWGTAYVVDGTGNDAPVLYIMNFADAIAAATAAEVEEVHVYAHGAQNRTTSDYAAANGAYTIETEITIPEFMELKIHNALIVGESGRLILEEGAIVSIEKPGMNYAVLWNNGKVIDYGGAMEEYEGEVQAVQNPPAAKSGERALFVYEVKKTTDTDTEYYVTYTSLAIAISESQAGETIELNGKVTITDDLTIPADVTVVTDDAIKTNKEALEINGATLTINGTLDLSVAGQKVAVTDNADNNRKGSIVLNNIIANADENTFTNGASGGYTVAGAYFNAKIGDDESARDYVTTVAIAGENSAAVEGVDGITIRGTVAAGTVTFTEGENVELVINVLGTITSGNITLVNADLDITNGTITGTVTSEVASGTSTMDFSRTSGVKVAISSTDDGENITTAMEFSGTTLKGNATVTAGEVVLDGSMTVGTYTKGGNGVSADYAVLTVGTGATLTIPKDATLTVASYGSTVKDYSGLVVDGTLAIDKGTILITATGTGVDAGQADINGTMTIDGKDQTIAGIINVTGEVTVAENYKMTVYRMYVGDDEGAAGTFTGSVDLDTTSGGIIFAYPNADMTNAAVSVNPDGTVLSNVTVFYINGEVYMTSYALDNTQFGTIMSGPVSLVGYEDVPATGWYDNAEMTGNPIESDEIIDDLTAAYAKAEPSQALVYVSVGSNMSVFIDDVRYSNGSIVALDVGQHTISVQVNPGYTGETTVLFNSTAVTGGTFEITPEMADEFEIVSNPTASDCVVLSVTGNISLDTGSTGSSSDDSGMGLTDYLLIILVVLIVIMAIMVAMRLMRS